MRKNSSLAARKKRVDFRPPFRQVVATCRIRRRVRQSLIKKFAFDPRLITY